MLSSFCLLVELCFFQFLLALACQLFLIIKQQMPFSADNSIYCSCDRTKSDFLEEKCHDKQTTFAVQQLLLPSSSVFDAAKSLHTGP